MRCLRRFKLIKGTAFIKFFLIIFVNFITLSKGLGKHIIGGDMYYECVSIDNSAGVTTLHIVCEMYRDNRCTTNGEDCAYFDGDNRSTSPNASPGAEFGVYRQTNEGWVYVKSTTAIRPENIIKVPINDIECLITPPGVDIESGTYQFDIELELIDNNYLIAYQRCCRSESISNLVNPGNFGAVFSIEITPDGLKSCNNSPRFREFPPALICAGFDLIYDHSANDKEQDQVLYEFCTPLSSGGPNGASSRSDCNMTPVPDPSTCLPSGFQFVTFQSPTFTTQAPMGGNPVVSINSETGLITGRPNILGEYVIGVCASEYRNGLLLSKTRRDFQWITLVCDPPQIPDLPERIVVGSYDDLRFNLVDSSIIGAYQFKLINNTGFLNISSDLSQYSFDNICNTIFEESITYEVCSCFEEECKVQTTVFEFDLEDLLKVDYLPDTLILFQTDRGKIDLLENDDIEDVLKKESSISVLSTNSTEANVDLNGAELNYVLDYVKYEDYQDTIHYEICICETICDTSFVEIFIRNNVDQDIQKVITPNGDGYNDTFQTGIPNLASGFPDNELIIFNRWGDIIESKQPYDNDWTGESLPEGVYYILFKLNGRNNFSFRGSVTVIR